MAENRQALMTAFKTRFALITTSNGYRTNIGQRVKEFQTTPLGEEERTALMIHDPIDSVLPDPNGPNSNRRTWALTVIVDVQLQESDQNAIQARKAISDVKQAVAVDHTWGGLAKRSEELSDRLLRDNKGANITGAQITFRVITSRAPWAQ